MKCRWFGPLINYVNQQTLNCFFGKKKGRDAVNYSQKILNKAKAVHWAKAKECSFKIDWRMNNVSNTAIVGSSHGYVYKTILTFVAIFGSLGNAVVILSMLRKRRLLKNNFYYLVFHVTICDFSYLLVSVYDVYSNLAGKELDYSNPAVCVVFLHFRELYLLFGAYFMLVISIVRYRAVLHPLKPAISYRRLKVVSCFLYLLLIFISGPNVYFCFGLSPSFLQNYGAPSFFVRTTVWYFLPATIMSLIYWKICRELIRQNNSIKSSKSMTLNNCGNTARLLHHRNWRTFLVSSVIVICFVVGGLPKQVSYFQYARQSHDQTVDLHKLMDYGWLTQAAATCAMNPLIYGILDRKLLSIIKLCQKKK